MPMFKMYLLQLLNASNTRDGIRLQNLGEAEIIDSYKAGQLTLHEYTALEKVYNIFIQEWRENYK